MASHSKVKEQAACFPGAKACARELLFRPAGLACVPLFPRLAPWAVFLRRFRGRLTVMFHGGVKILVLTHTLEPLLFGLIVARLKRRPSQNHLSSVSIHRVVFRHYPLPAFIFERD
jgi:hypothetical protein